jgi:hypothetical protein
MKLSIAVFLTFVSVSASVVGEPRGVPRKLFEIPLGAVYELSDDPNDIGKLPVKKGTGAKKFLGEGLHFYFQPSKEYRLFDYREAREKPEDKFFETSFSLYLLPVIPPRTKTLEELHDSGYGKWEVSHIRWISDKIKQEDAYFWAKDLCATFQADLSIEPEVIDHYGVSDSYWYKCTFADKDREFSVDGNYGRKNVALSFTNEIFEQKNAVVEEKRRKLQAEEIRPY